MMKLPTAHPNPHPLIQRNGSLIHRLCKVTLSKDNEQISTEVVSIQRTGDKESGAARTLFCGLGRGTNTQQGERGNRSDSLALELYRSPFLKNGWDFLFRRIYRIPLARSQKRVT